MSFVERKDLFLSLSRYLPRELNLLVMLYLEDYCPWWSRRLGVKKVYDVEVLSVEECKELQRESSHCSRTLLLEDRYRVSSTFYYNIEEDEASGQYYDEDDLVTWYYYYEIQYWFFI